MDFPPIQFMRSMSDKYGDIFTFRMGKKRAYFIKSPEFIREVLVTRQSSFEKEDFLQRGRVILGSGLVTSDRELHRRQRRLLQPAFHKERIEIFASSMREYAETAVAQWEPDSTLDLLQEMHKLTLRIVAKTLFNRDIERDHGRIGEVLSSFLELFNLLAFPIEDDNGDSPSDSNESALAAREKIDALIYQMITEARNSGLKGDDLLSMLLEAKEPDGTPAMSDEQLRDELVTIYLAGHETVANAMCWSWYLLSRNRDAERKFHAEIDALYERGGFPSVDDLSSLKYTRSVLAESMRLYPPVWALGRVAIEQTKIGNRTIPEGSVVVMSQYITQREPDYFSRPDEFIPQRWIDGTAQNIPEFAYFPFGGGARRCIGEQYAWTEGIILLATIGRHFRLVDESIEPIEPLFLLTLRPKQKLMMRFEKRVH